MSSREREREVTLYKTKLAFQRHIPEQSLMGEKIKVTDSCEDDFVCNLMRAQLTGYLYGEPGETQTISYPPDWWSAFKQRWFPTWLLRRYPASLTIVEINLLTLYPHFKVSLPDQHHVLKYTVNKTESLEAVDEYTIPER